MKSSSDVTVTDARMKDVLKKQVVPLVMESVSPVITREVETAKLRTGVVTKFYPYLDKAEVKLDNSNLKVLCRLPHKFGGALIDFFTPAGDGDFCEDFKEPCIFPRDPLYCLIVKIHEDDSDDYLLVDYYLGDEILGFDPAPPGSMRISNFRASCEDYIEFGGDGLKIQTKKPIETSYGEYEDDVTIPVYADADDVYTKDEVYTKKEVYAKREVYSKQEVYTKKEVDDLIAEKIAEALENQDEGD